MKKPESKFASILRTRQEDLDKNEATPVALPRRGRPGGKGKRLDPDYAQVTAYILKKLHEETKIKLIRQGNREFSDLVSQLLEDWNLQQAEADKIFGNAASRVVAPSK